MLFLGLFTLAVLPLFLVVCGRMLVEPDNPSVGRRIAAGIFYLIACGTILSGLLVIVHAGN